MRLITIGQSATMANPVHPLCPARPLSKRQTVLSTGTIRLSLAWPDYTSLIESQVCAASSGSPRSTSAEKQLRVGRFELP